MCSLEVLIFHFKNHPLNISFLTQLMHSRLYKKKKKNDILLKNNDVHTESKSYFNVNVFCMLSLKVPSRLQYYVLLKFLGFTVKAQKVWTERYPCYKEPQALLEGIDPVNAKIHKAPETHKIQHQRKHKDYGQPKSIFLSGEKKSLFKGLTFCVTIIVGLNRMVFFFFQFGGCNHSLKHVLIEKSLMRILIILTFFTWSERGSFFISFYAKLQ